MPSNRLFELCYPRYNDSPKLRRFKKYVSMLARLAEETRSDWSSISMALDIAMDNKDMDRVRSLALEEEEAGNQLLSDNNKRDYFAWLLFPEVHHIYAS